MYLITLEKYFPSLTVDSCGSLENEPCISNHRDFNWPRAPGAALWEPSLCLPCSSQWLNVTGILRQACYWKHGGTSDGLLWLKPSKPYCPTSIRLHDNLECFLPFNLSSFFPLAFPHLGSDLHRGLTVLLAPSIFSHQAFYLIELLPC